MVRIGAEEEIKVKWIVLVYYLALLGCVIYVIVDCVINHRYADFSEPTAFRSAWLVGDRSWKGPKSEYFCQNASFDWPLTVPQYDIEGPHNLTNVSCTWVDSNVIRSFITFSEIGLPTEVEYFRNDSIVPDPFFVTQIDKVIINFNHGFFHPTKGTVTLPETIVYDKSGKEFKRLKKDSILSFSFPELMTLMHANLDAKQPTLPQLGIADSTFRHTGLYTMISFVYTNFEANQADEEILCRVQITVVDNVWGVLGTDDKAEWHGVKMLLKGTGSIGWFSEYVTFVYVLNTIVFIGIAEFFARQCYLVQERLRAFCGEWAEEMKSEDGDGAMERELEDTPGANDAPTIPGEVYQVEDLNGSGKSAKLE